MIEDQDVHIPESSAKLKAKKSKIDYVYSEPLLSKLSENSEKRFNEFSDAVDKVVLLFAPGCLAFSVTVLKDIAPNGIEAHKATLILGWFALGASLIFSLLSTELALRCLKIRLHALFDHHEARAVGMKKVKLPKSSLELFASWSHNFALVFLLLGLSITSVSTIQAVLDSKVKDKANSELSAVELLKAAKEYAMSDQKKIVTGEIKNIGKKIKEGSVVVPIQKPIVPPTEGTEETKK